MKIFDNLEVNIKNIINLSQSLEREIDLIKNTSINIYSDCYMQNANVNRR
jgi:hypothetical protein